MNKIIQVWYFIFTNKMLFLKEKVINTKGAIESSKNK
jgi:hypothetical protein